MVSLDYVLYSLRWGSRLRLFTLLVALAALGMVALTSFLQALAGPDGQIRRVVTIEVPVKAEADRRQELTDLNAHLRRNPEDVNARLKLAEILVETGEYESARAMVRAMAKQVTQPREQIRLARIYMRLGENDRAIEALKLVSSDHDGAVEEPSFGALYEAAILHGEAALRLQSYQEALASIENLPQNAPAVMFLRARGEYGLGHWQKARDLINTLHEFDEFPIRSHLFEARMALNNNLPDEAFAAIEKARESNVNDWDVRLLETELAVREGRFKDAAAWLDAMEAAAPGFVATKQVRALYYAAQGDYQLAAQILDKLDGWTGGSMDRSLLHALVKMETGDLMQASKLLKEYADAAPDNKLVRELNIALALKKNDLLTAEGLIAKSANEQDQLSAQTVWQFALRQRDYLKGRSLMVDLALNPSQQPSSKQQRERQTVYATLLGPHAKLVHTQNLRIEAQEDQRHVLRLLLSNQPQKALALFEDKKASFENAFANVAGEYAFNTLLYVELLLANFKSDEALMALKKLPEIEQLTPYASLLRVRTEKRLQAGYISDLPVVSLAEELFSAQNASDRNIPKEERMLRLARQFEAQGLERKAGRAYREAVLAAPEKWDVLSAFVAHMSKGHRKAEGLAFLRALTNQAKPFEAGSGVVAARIMLEAADPVQALRRYHTRHPTFMTAFALAEVLGEKGQQAEAVRVLERAAAKSVPGIEDTIIIAGKLFALGEQRKAVRYLDKEIVRLWPETKYLSQVYPVIAMRARLGARRAGNSRKDTLSDVEYARWAWLLQPLENPDDGIGKIYAALLDRAGYYDKAKLVSREFQEVPAVSIQDTQDQLVSNEPLLWYRHFQSEEQLPTDGS